MMEWKDKRVLVVGAGISGNAAALLAQSQGARVCLSDAKAEAQIKCDLQPLREAGVEVALGAQQENLLDGVDLAIVSPGVPIGIPLLERARARGIAVMSEVEVAYRMARAPLFAVTGTNGKTTTTMLVGELMKKRFAEVGVGGNIGTPLSVEAARVGAAGCLVAEISSYQLEGVDAFRPKIAAVLNLTPDHLARHKTMEAYRRMKERIFAQQAATDFLVLNYDDEAVRGMAARAASQVFFFSRLQALEAGAFVADGRIQLRRDGATFEVCAVSELQIKGGHNVENALAASAMAFLAGVSPQDIADTLRSFPGVEHRIEPVATVGGVPYYNDSKATNPESAIKALETFDGHVLLIAGGHDKNTDLTAFMQRVRQKADALILVGAASARFKDAALRCGVGTVLEAGYSMETAVRLAHELAAPPQVVLLSPACASFDMFDGFEARGRAFKTLVRQLPEK